MDLLSDSALSINDTDVEVCSESSDFSHPTTRLEIRLRMNYEDPITVIESAEIAIDEECRSTVGEVVSVALRLLNQSPLIAAVEHDLAIQMSHANFCLTRAATAHSTEFKLKEDLVDCTVLMCWPFTTVLVTSGVEPTPEYWYCCGQWAPTKYPSDTEYSSSESDTHCSVLSASDRIRAIRGSQPSASVQ